MYIYEQAAPKRGGRLKRVVTTTEYDEEGNRKKTVVVEEYEDNEPVLPQVWYGGVEYFQKF